MSDTYSVIYSPQAKKDIRDIYSYIASNYWFRALPKVK